MGRSRQPEQLAEIVVYAGHTKIRLPLERSAQRVHPVCVIVQKLDDGQDEVVRLVERVEDLVARHGDGLGAGDSALDLDEAKLAGSGNAALDVVPELLE
jgi:hypothetical protein